MIGLGKEIDDIRDARLDSERNTRTLLDESRKENDRVSAIFVSITIFPRSNRKRYTAKMKEEERKIRDIVSSFFSYEIIDFGAKIQNSSFIFGQNSQSRILHTRYPYILTKWDVQSGCSGHKGKL